MGAPDTPRASRIRGWFHLTPEERRIAAGILVIALIGVAARYLHLRRQASTGVPAGLTEQPQPDGARP